MKLYRLCTALFTLPLLFSPSMVSHASQPHATRAADKSSLKVLIVVSSEGRDQGKTRPGFEMDEFAQAYLVLRANGIKVDVASPAGGTVEADNFNPKDDHYQALAADGDAMQSLNNTRRTSEVKVGEHAAIFVMGGKGAMFDLPKDQALLRLLAQTYERGGVISAVCHGPAVFANVTRADGKPLLAGKRVTGFTDEEEALFGKKWVKEYPFLIETKVREQGALWQEAALMMPKTVIDGKLITGQNPFSTVQTAEAIVRALGKEPAPRIVFKEEISMQLVERWLGGERDTVRALLNAEPKKYKTDLIAMLGYYQSQAATTDDARRTALSVMELAAPHMPHPRLKLGIAATHTALGNTARAREILTALVAEAPDLADAKKALAALPN